MNITLIRRVPVCVPWTESCAPRSMSLVLTEPPTSEWKLARFGNVQSRVFQKPELEEKLEAEMAAMPDLSDP